MIKQRPMRRVLLVETRGEANREFIMASDSILTRARSKQRESDALSIPLQFNCAGHKQPNMFVVTSFLVYRGQRGL
jgi:hypothetical protein